MVMKDREEKGEEYILSWKRSETLQKEATKETVKKNEKGRDEE